MDWEVRDQRDEADKTFKQINLIMAKNTRAVRQMMFSLMEDIHASAIKEIESGVKSGRVYKRIKIRVKRNKKGQFVKGSGRVKRNHQASAPGETHADLSEDAKKSLSWKVYGSESADFGYGVSVTDANAAPPYVDDLEFGTDRVKARPTLQNELKHVGSKAQSHFNDALKDEGFEG